jgi:hypothetical protein
MITVASFPADLGAWDQDEDPFYLEVFGEASSLLDMTHAEVIPVGGAAAASASPTPIYEYWWTIGHTAARGLSGARLRPPSELAMMGTDERCPDRRLFRRREVRGRRRAGPPGPGIFR